MALIIFFFAAGLFAYWLLRVWVLAFGDAAAIDEILDGDVRRFRHLLLLLRMLVLPPREMWLC